MNTNQIIHTLDFSRIVIILLLLMSIISLSPKFFILTLIVELLRLLLLKKTNLKDFVFSKGLTFFLQILLAITTVLISIIFLFKLSFSPTNLEKAIDVQLTSRENIDNFKNHSTAFLVTKGVLPSIDKSKKALLIHHSLPTRKVKPFLRQISYSKNIIQSQRSLVNSSVQSFKTQGVSKSELNTYQIILTQETTNYAQSKSLKNNQSAQDIFDVATYLTPILIFAIFLAIVQSILIFLLLRRTNYSLEQIGEVISFSAVFSIIFILVKQTDLKLKFLNVFQKTASINYLEQVIQHNSLLVLLPSIFIGILGLTIIVLSLKKEHLTLS